MGVRQDTHTSLAMPAVLGREEVPPSHEPALRVLDRDQVAVHAEPGELRAAAVLLGRAAQGRQVRLDALPVRVARLQRLAAAAGRDLRGTEP